MSNTSVLLCFIVLTAFAIANASGSESKERIGVYALKKGDLSVKFTNWGATIISLVLPDKNGKLADVVLGYDSVKEYTTCIKLSLKHIKYSHTLTKWSKLQANGTPIEALQALTELDLVQNHTGAELEFKATAIHQPNSRNKLQWYGCSNSNSRHISMNLPS